MYDKREEQLRRASYVTIIWKDNLEKMGVEQPNWSDTARSRVWRVEIRFFKDYLKNTCKVRTFADLAAALPDMLRTTVDQIRYATPTGDSNRARWPDHPLWQRVREEIECDFSTIRSEVDRESVDAFILAEKDQYLARQIAGCMLNRAAIRNVGLDGLRAFTIGQAQQIAENFEARPDRTKEKLVTAKTRYGVTE